MMTLSDLAGRIELDLKTKKSYTGPPLLVAAARPDREVVIIDPVANPASVPTTTVQLNRGKIEEELTDYGGSVMAVADLVASSSAVYELLVPEDKKEAEIKIGRDDHNDVMIQAPGVSGDHALIRYQYGRWLLADLGSKNGTWVNKTALAPESEKKLVSCDCLRFGERVFYFLAGQYILHFLNHWIENRSG